MSHTNLKPQGEDMETVSSPARHSGLLDKKYREFFVPTILMAMTLTMSIVVDSIIVGNMLGSEALAAVNLVMPVVMLYNTVAVCVGLGAATVISIAKGRRQSDYANDIFTTALFVMLALGIVLLAVQLVYVDEITRLLTREPSLRDLVKSYVHVLIYGTPLIILVPGLAYCLRVDARVKMASTILIVSNLVNLVLDLVYMGPLKMGIAGSSLATVSGYIVGGVLLLLYALSSKRTLRFRPQLLTNLTELFAHARKIVTTGTPAAMGSILIMFKILCVNHIILAVAGKSGMVAFSVCLSCLSFVSMFISGAAQAMTPVVGVLYGEGDHQGVYFVVRRAFKTLLTASLVATILLELFPGEILQLFGIHHAADIAEGIPAIRLFSLSLVGTSITFLSMYYYMTISRTKLSTAISFVQGASVVPLALVLSYPMGASGVWLAFSLAEAVTILMIYLCYSSLKKAFPTKYTNPLLLNHEELLRYSRLELSCETDDRSIAVSLQQFSAFLNAGNIDQQLGTKVIAAIDKVMNGIKASSPESTGTTTSTMDMMLDIYTDKIVAHLRGNTKESKLAREQQASLEETSSSHLTCSQAIGFNNYNLTFNRE